MTSLLYTEILKLKRSRMLLISALGALTVPFMCFIGFLVKTGQDKSAIGFEEFFSETNMYIVLLTGVLLYGLLSSYLFIREFNENTLKSIITIPVSKVSIIISKLIILLAWIIILTFLSWGFALVLGVSANFSGLNYELVQSSLGRFTVGGVSLFLLSVPTVFITVVFRNYIPAIVFNIIIAMANIIFQNSEYSRFYPWSAVYYIVNGMNGSYVSVPIIFISGLAATIIYINKTDVD